MLSRRELAIAAAAAILYPPHCGYRWASDLPTQETGFTVDEMIATATARGAKLSPDVHVARLRYAGALSWSQLQRVVGELNTVVPNYCEQLDSDPLRVASRLLDAARFAA